MDKFLNTDRTGSPYILDGTGARVSVPRLLRRELRNAGVRIVIDSGPSPRRPWGALTPGYTFIRFSDMWHVYGMFTEDLRRRIRAEGSVFITHALKSKIFGFEDLLIEDIDEASGPRNIGHVTVGTMQGLEVVASAIRTHYTPTKDGHKTPLLSSDPFEGPLPPSIEDVSTEPEAHERAGTMGSFVNITALEDEPLRRDTIIKELIDANVGAISSPGERPFGFVPPHYTFVRRIDEWTVHGLFPLDLVNLIGSDPACSRDKVRFFSTTVPSRSAFNYDLVEVRSKQALRAIVKTIRFFRIQEAGIDIAEGVKRERADTRNRPMGYKERASEPPIRRQHEPIATVRMPGVPESIPGKLSWIEGALKVHHKEHAGAIQEVARRVSRIETILEDKGISPAMPQRRNIDFASIPPESSRVREEGEEEDVNVSVAVGQKYRAVSGSGIATVANVLPPIRKGNEVPDMVIVSHDGMLMEYPFPHPFVDLFVPVLDEDESLGEEQEQE